MKYFTYKGYRDYEKCYFQFDHYSSNGTTALTVLSDLDYEPIATLSVNLDYSLEPQYFWVKGYDGYKEAADELVKEGIIEQVIEDGEPICCEGGYAKFYLYRITPTTLEYSSNPEDVREDIENA